MFEFENYIDDLAKDALGENRFWELLQILEDVPNGHCGVELYHRTIPMVLAKRGVVPKKTYVDTYGMPNDDGKQAASLEQQEVIRKALKKAGYL